MPVLADLADDLNDVLGELSTSGSRFPPTPDVELLLSSLAVDQPFLDEATNLRNRALFVELRGWLARRIFDAQRHTLGSPIPHWLETLVQIWHEREATVITMNYDTLVESAVMSMHLDSGGDRVLPQHTYALPVPFAAPGSYDRYGQRHTFLLCKLHGSLSWFGRTRPHQEAREVEVWKDAFNSAERAPWEDIAHRAIGMGEPFLVPPVLVKSEHFENELIRANWSQAYLGLESASTVVIMGYSFPAGDSQMAALVGSSARDKDIIIVDRNGTEVQKRVRNACSGSRFSTISHTPASEHSIIDFVGEYAERFPSSE